MFVKCELNSQVVNMNLVTDFYRQHNHIFFSLNSSNENEPNFVRWHYIDVEDAKKAFDKVVESVQLT